MKTKIRFFELWWSDPDEGSCLAWAETVTDAVVKKAAIRADYPRGKKPKVRVTRCTVAADSAGIVHWLNIHFTRNNG